MQPFTTEFILSRDYLAESFDESFPHGAGRRPKYLLIAVWLGLGVGLLSFTEVSAIVGIFLVALAVLEMLHLRFQRTWWLARQMWGRSANCKVTLAIDDAGIRTRNPFTETSLSWSDIERVIETQLGLILVIRSGGQQYLSKTILVDDCIEAIMARVDNHAST